MPHNTILRFEWHSGSAGMYARMHLKQWIEKKNSKTILFMVHFGINLIICWNFIFAIDIKGLPATVIVHSKFPNKRIQTCLFVFFHNFIN